MKNILNILIGCLCLVWGGCLSELDLEQDRRQFIAFTGVISNNPDERTIKMFENVPTFGSIKGRLYKNEELEANLEFVDFRALGIPDHVVIEPGASYYIEVDTDGGITYRSKPQYVHESYSPESLNYSVDWQNFEQDDGKIIQRYGVDILATVPVLPAEPPIYLRYQISESWSFKEVDDPRVEDDTLNTCYIVRKPVNFEPVFWKTTNLVQGPSQVLLARRIVNEDFLHRHYFNIYTYRLTKEAANYYDRTERLLQAEGLMIDEIPAPAIGNVYNVESGDRVYGYVEFSLPDTSRIFVDGSALGVDILDPCSEDPCPEPAQDGSLPDCPCADCRFIPGASYEKPPYFK